MNTTSLPLEASERRDIAVLAAEGSDLEAAFFAEPARVTRSSFPPVAIGDFLGDELADAWLR